MSLEKLFLIFLGGQPNTGQGNGTKFSLGNFSNICVADGDLHLECVRIQHWREGDDIELDGRELFQLLACLTSKYLQEIRDKFDRNRAGLVAAESPNHSGTIETIFTACLPNLVVMAAKVKCYLIAEIVLSKMLDMRESIYIALEDRGEPLLPSAASKKNVQLVRVTDEEVYRFSISRPKLITYGRRLVNPNGLQYYNSVIKEVLSHGIQNILVIYFDRPHAFKDKYGEGCNTKEVRDFSTYVDVCLKELTTFNDANMLTMAGYGMGIMATSCWSFLLCLGCTKEWQVSICKEIFQFCRMHVILIFTPTCPYLILVLCFLEKFNKWKKKWWEFKSKHMDKVLSYKMEKFYEYLGMNKHVTGVRNLFDKIESSLDEIKYWTWYENLATIKQKEVVSQFLVRLPKTEIVLVIGFVPGEKGKQWELIPFVSKNNDAEVLLAMMVELTVFIHDIEGLEHAHVLSSLLVSNIPMVKRSTAFTFGCAEMVYPNHKA